MKGKRAARLKTIAAAIFAIQANLKGERGRRFETSGSGIGRQAEMHGAAIGK